MSKLLLILFCWAVAGSVSTALGIVGGKVTNIKKHPYHVTIVGQCSGAIIHKRWILTLASCVVPYYAYIKRYPIRTGSNSQSEGGKLYYPEKAVLHNKFDFATGMYDFALLKTNQTIAFDKKTKMIAYARKKSKVRSPGVVSGWGEAKPNNETAFKEVTLNTIDFITCQKLYNSGDVHVYDTMLCAASKDKVQGPCTWDYGAPYVIKKKLQGIFQVYVKCPAKEYPSIFSDVSSAAKWIKKTISTF